MPRTEISIPNLRVFVNHKAVLYTNSMENRVKQVRAILKTEKLDALLISSNYNIRYLTGFAGFGTHEREGFALLTHSNLYICADPRLSEGARKNSKNAKIVEFGAGKKLLPQLQEIIDQEEIEVVGFEENLTYSEYKRFKKLKVKFKMTEEVIEFVRQVKDVDELKSLQAACKLTDDTFSHVLKKIKANMTEKELGWEMEKFIREHGGELSFPSIVAFGENSAIPHHATSSYQLKANTCVLLDFGAMVDGYHADMTRTFYFGKAPEQFKKMYEVVKVAQELAFCHPELGSGSKIPKRVRNDKKITPEIVDKLARDYIIAQGYPSIPHSVGHGVGLEVHELPHISPSFDEELEPNTPFTIEPGIYINGYGGVRIEDTVFYDGKEITAVTKSPKKLLEIS